METKYLNFKKIELSAATKDEAKAKAPFGIQGDATQAWKNWKAKQVDGVTDAKFKDFCLTYLETKTKNVPGSGFIIVVDPAVVDKRERPYKKVNVKNEDGKREWDTNLQIIGETTGTVYATVTVDDVKKTMKKEELVDENGEPKTIRVKKSDADKVVKALYTETGITEHVIVKYVKETRNPSQAIAARYEYTPTKGTKNGTYIVFGIEA